MPPAPADDAGPGAAPAPTPRHPGRWSQIVVVIVVGLMIRLALSAASIGTNDILTWRKFAGSVHDRGLVNSYRTIAELNHPPLPALWAAASLRIADATGVRFPFVFRLPALIADIGSCVLLAVIWRRRVARGAAPRAAPV